MATKRELVIGREIVTRDGTIVKMAPAYQRPAVRDPALRQCCWMFIAAATKLLTTIRPSPC